MGKGARGGSGNLGLQLGLSVDPRLRCRYDRVRTRVLDWLLTVRFTGLGDPMADLCKQEEIGELGDAAAIDRDSRIDTGETKKKGDNGAKVREAEAAQNAGRTDAESNIVPTQRQGAAKKEDIKFNTELKIFENQRKGDVLESDAAFTKKKALCDKETKLANVEAKNAVDIRDAELKTDLEKKKAKTQTEKLRADLLSKAIVDYEIKVQEANWELYKKQRAADADLYCNEQAAKAQKANAEASLFAKQKEAEGIVVMAEAEGLYLNTLMKQLGGSYLAVRDYLMIKNNMFQDIAKINAQAVQGLQPKISLWSQGNNACGGGESNGGAMKDMAAVYSMLPPLLSTIQEQTGMLPPTWLGSLPAAPQNDRSQNPGQ